MLKVERSFDFAVFYPGRETGGKVLRENDLADAIQRELGKMSNTVYYADRDRTVDLTTTLSPPWSVAAELCLWCRACGLSASGVWRRCCLRLPPVMTQSAR
jgi:hypothetical protein